MQNLAADISALQSRLESHKQQEPERKTIKCATCGTTSYFSPNQWRVNCLTCGTVITRSAKGKTTGKINCTLCNDDGVICYNAQHEENIYPYMAKCICGAGDKFINLPLITDWDNVPGPLMDKVNENLFGKGA